MTAQDPAAFGAPATGSGLAPGSMTGFGDGFGTEALPGALPVGRKLILSGRCRREGFAPIGYGECRAVIRPAL